MRPTSNKTTLSSFKNAFRGIGLAIRDSGHLKFHLLAAAGVIVAGLILGLSSFEWLALLLIISAVISAEIINTCVENIENIIRDHAGVPYEFTGKAKDMGAGAVLVFAIAAVVVALIIFLPKITPISIDMFSRMK